MSLYKLFNGYWDNILEFNKSFNKDRNSYNLESIKNLEEIGIPYFPIMINPFLFNKLMKAFSFIINGDNGNCVEIIYDEEEKLIESLTLIKADKEGNYTEIIENPLNLIKLEYNQIEDLENLFDIIKTEILNQHYIDIGTIKLVNSKLIKKVTEEFDIDYDEVKNIDKKQYGNKILKLFIQIIEDNWLKIYPDQPFLMMANKIMSQYGEFIKHIINNNVFSKLLPKENVSITFVDEDWYLTFIVLNNSPDGMIDLKIMEPYTFGEINTDNSYKWINLLKSIEKAYKKQFNIKCNYIINVKSLTELITDITESEIPINEDRFKFLLQKILFGIKNIETNWDVRPKSILYYEFFRWFINNLGYRINPRKISYWSLPELLLNNLKENLGENSKILVLTGNSINECSDGFILKYIDSKLINIELIDGSLLKDYIGQAQKNVISSNAPEKKSKSNNNNSRLLPELQKIVKNEWGFLNQMIFIQNSQLENIIQTFTIDIHSLNPIRLLKITKILKNIKKNEEIIIYPKTPSIRYLESMGTLKFFKEFGSILFDVLEF